MSADPGFALRAATSSDASAIWSILEPVLREGETYALPAGWTRSEALGYWFAPAHQVFLAEERGEAVGAYYLQPNQMGGADHVANCGFVTAPKARRRGVARAMCRHALDQAARGGFRAMQFNFVVSTNVHAIALWEALGFRTVGRLPGAFRHPRDGFVDALVMFRELEANVAAWALTGGRFQS